jgi:diaminopimelate epimerase
MSDQPIPFRKMNGLGNEFVIFDARGGAIELPPEAIRALGAEDSIGFDQMITIEPPADGGDAFMRIHNRDGGEVDACGNATRCVGRVLMEESGSKTAAIATNAGILRAFDGGADNVTVDMGKPRFAWNEIPLAEPWPDTRELDLQVGPEDAPVLAAPSAVSMGNPHVIFWVDDVAAYDLAGIGPTIETHPMFPARVNVSLAHVVDRQSIEVRTWERGVGLTRACGTAACAAAVAAMRKGLVDRRVTVTLPGGPLAIEWRDDDHVWMTGPVEAEFEGAIDPETLSWSVTSPEPA